MAPVFLVIGMAGSGKTTFVQRLNAWVRESGKRDYIMNLDPAVYEVPYKPKIDIRDTVKYKEIMRQYELGPNGAILTALNLFATKFDQVLDLMQERNSDTDYFIVDTPGQIELFTWSASGSIITESISLAHPTVVLYVVDTVKCTCPTTFMSNMLYACSILYRTRLPFILLLNKTDLQDCEFIKEWMTDFESFQESMAEKDEGFMSSLVTSMSLVLEEFYNCLRVVGVSSVTGDGKDEFFDAIEAAVKEYNEEFLPELDKIVQKGAKGQEEKQQAGLNRLMDDLKLDREGKIILERE